jgi:hypothetical protein
MHFEFLVEDRSGKKALDILVGRSDEGVRGEMTGNGTA